MKTKLCVDGREIFLNPFIADLMGNVAQGIVASIKVEDPEVRKIEFHLRESDVAGLAVNDQPVSLQLSTGFVRQIIGSTLRGLLQPLKGTEGAKEVLIKV